MHHRSISYHLVLLGLYLSLGSCDRSVKTNKEGIISGIEVQVQSTAGDTLEQFGANGIPMFLNHATLDVGRVNLDFLVLGPPINRNSKIGVVPLGTLNFEMGNRVRSFHLAKVGTEPNSQTQRNPESELIKYKSSIEAWFRMQCPAEVCHSYDWQLPIHLYKQLDSIDAKQS